MKLLVTGREGQLVQSLAERCSSMPGIEFVAAGRPELDLQDPGSIERAILAHAPDVVISAAAYTAVDQAEDEPGLALAINGEGAGAVASAARKAGARIIQISTDYVFDGSSSEPYQEGASVNPIGVYGRSKLAGEEQVRRNHPEHLIVRIAWVYSPFGRNFLKTMMKLAESRDVLTVVDDQHGNPSSALDLADGLLSIVRAWQSSPSIGIGEVYHLAGSGSASWREFAQEIFDECARLGLPSAEAKPILTADWPTKARRPANSRLDCEKFFRDFSYKSPAWQASAAQTVRRLSSVG